MAQLDEVTSTEKLLDVIRKKAGNGTPERANPSRPTSSVLPPPGKNRLIPIRKKKSNNETIGVDVGHNYLRLVKIIRGADRKPRLVDLKQVPIPPEYNRSFPELAEFLKKELHSFSGSRDHQQIWAILSAVHVEVHHIRIPKVPKKQIEKVVYWTVKKEDPFDEKEVIFDFEVLEEVEEQRIPKLNVMYYTAKKQAVEEIKRLFSHAGWPLTGLSITPFALQNVFRTGLIPGYEDTAANLFIGNDFSRIDIYSHGNLVMTRGIKAGINSMIESLIEDFNESQANVGAIGSLMDKDAAREILFNLNSEKPTSTRGEFYGLDKKAVREMLLPALERLVRQVERTIGHFTTNLGSGRINRIYVSGVLSLDRPIAKYVGDQLGIESVVFDVLSSQVLSLIGSNSFITTYDRIAFAPAFGIAISDNNYTPNLIFTYKDKEREAKFKRFNSLVLISFIALACICGGIFSYQLYTIGQRERTIGRLNEELVDIDQLVNKDKTLNSMSIFKKDVLSAKAYAQRYQDIAIVSELSRIISPEIRLTSLKAKLGDVPPVSSTKVNSASAQAKEKEKPGQPSSSSGSQTKIAEVEKEVEIEGFVLGPQKSQEVSLANFSIKLESSPLFQQVKIQKTNEETFKRTMLLHFVITMKLEGI